MSRPPFVVGPLTPWFERSLDVAGWEQLRALRSQGHRVIGFASSARGPFTARVVIDDGKGPLTFVGIGSSANEALARLAEKVAA